MSYLLIKVLSLFVGVPALIGLLRVNKICETYRPFILLMTIGFANELISWVVTQKGYSNAVNTNIFYLLDALLLTFFFQKNKLFERKDRFFYTIIFLFLLVWIVELFFLRSINEFSSYFIILYALAVVIMSINMINRINNFGERTSPIRQPLFIICLGFVIFYTYTVLIEIFWVYGLNSSAEFQREVYRILAYINLAVNLIYALALLWIPKKRESLLQ